MIYQEKINPENMSKAAALVTRHVGIEVMEAAVHGSVLRGFNDPNSDTDICFLLNRPISDYVNTTTAPFFEYPVDERRRKMLHYSQLMTRELGWGIMISLLDMRSLLRGIMGASSFALMSYESLALKNEKVCFLFETVVEDYFKVENLVYRCGERINKGLRTYNEIIVPGMEYKKERSYLGTLWSAHRLLAYLGGDTKHCRTIQELIKANKPQWGDDFSEGFTSQVVGVIHARTDRSPFDLPTGINAKASELLGIFVIKVLKEATAYLRVHPTRFPTAMEEAREMIDLYGALIDEEDDRTRTRLVS